MRMEMSTSLSCRLELRQTLSHTMSLPWRTNPFWTEGEIDNENLKEVLERLKKTKPEDYWDTVRFKQIVNREIWKHKLSDESNRFRKSIGNLINVYSPDHTLAIEICDLLLTKGEDETLPGQVAHHWAELVSDTGIEGSKYEFLSLARDLRSKNVEVVGAFDLLYQVREDKDSIKITSKKIKQYAANDSRQIDFTQKTLKPLLRRGIGDRSLSAVILGLEQWYVIDRQLEERTGTDVVADLISSGLPLHEKIPLPILAFASSLDDPLLLESVISHRDFREGREIQRKIYHGLAALSEHDNGSAIYQHLCQNLKRPKDLAKALGIIDVLRKDQGFNYDMSKTLPSEILRSLQLRLVDKNISRIGLDDKHIEAFIDRSSDSDFRMIGQIATTLAGYYQNNDDLMSVLREVTDHVLDGDFNEWKYSHDGSEKQLAVLGKNISAWKKNSSVTRIVGELKALESHIEAVHTALPKLKQSYEETYDQKYSSELIEQVRSEREELVKELKTLKKGSEKKRIGFEAGKLKDKIGYLELIAQTESLTTENYQQVIDYMDKVARTKKKAPFHEAALWTRETLDQPEYRSARRIHVYETDDAEALLRMGERPVPHCQNWRNNSTYNESLLSFVADANKKVIHIANGDGKPIAMTTLRLIDWDEKPVLLAENVYSKEWSDDYAVALVGTLAQKAYEMAEDIGKPVSIMTNNAKILKGFEKFSEKYKVEMHEDRVGFTMPPSKCPVEYVDCIGDVGQRFNSGSLVDLSYMKYIVFG